VRLPFFFVVLERGGILGRHGATGSEDLGQKKARNGKIDKEEKEITRFGQKESCQHLGEHHWSAAQPGNLGAGTVVKEARTY